MTRHNRSARPAAGVAAPLVLLLALLAALLEVENALIASTKEEEHRQTLILAVAANRTAVDLATSLYTAGENNFLAVLIAQRSLYAAEDNLAQSSLNVSTNLVALFKAMGGGWQPEVAPRISEKY